MLMVMDAQLELRSATATRSININQFYQGYKKLDLLPGELLTKISLPLPNAGDNLRLYKVSRRRDLDIASFTAAARMQLNGEQIVQANIALGAVGPTVIRPRKAEAFLAGKPFSAETMQQAGEIAADEVTPISDVRGFAEYRLQLTRNILIKYFYDLSETAATA
jgi:xanthine dehydrogenase small subunit